MCFVAAMIACLFVIPLPPVLPSVLSLIGASGAFIPRRVEQGDRIVTEI